ncbi:MAG: tRNA epoxyqueuosine(34) reductase QueG [Gemmatimonadales bacterium]
MSGREERLKILASTLGFTACGITDLGPSRFPAELDGWLAAGYGGTMRYLHRQAAKRKEPARIVAGATRAVVVLDNYAPPPEPLAASDGPAVQVAKYARGADYHDVTQERLAHLAEWLLAEGATIARPYADAGPVPERELAQRAGLGWIGKNTMLLRPGSGSLFFIGTVLTDLDLAVDAPFDLDHCGTCTRCLDACPTEAFVGPHILDATRCISYLTIEQKGPIPGEFVPLADGWAFGCDICNDVCPWNERFAEPTGVSAFLPRPVPDRTDPDYFERMDEVEFARRFADSPLSRPGLAGMQRNWRAAFDSREKGEVGSEKKPTG